MARVAIVEDESLVALDIARFLERRGHVVAGTFDSGDELLSAFDRLDADLVLMDVKIRGSRDGVETAGLVRERYGVPVVLLTAFADEDTVERAKRIEPFGYIIKPFEERALWTAMEIALYRGDMERRLMRSERKFRSLFEGSPGCNFLFDRSGVIIEANASFRAVFGDAAGLDLRSRFNDPVAFDDIVRALDADGSRPGAEYLLKGPDGGEVCMFASFSSESLSKGGEGGAWELAQGFAIDATERRRLEAQLRQAQKLEAIGSLAGGLAHDFNNVLTAVMGHADLLADSARDRPDLLDDIDGVRRASRRAASLSRRLLGFARRSVHEPRRLAPDELVAELERMLKRLLPVDIALSCAYGAGACRVNADPSHLEQIIVNLVVNARDAMPSGGTIRLTTEKAELAGPRAGRIGSVGAGPCVLLKVADTGTGIPPADLTRIFEPFYTTKGPNAGTGLGLAMVSNLVREAGGLVDVDSEPGRGSTFTVILPAIQASEAGHEAGTSVVGRYDPPVGLSALVVEGDSDVRDLLERTLGRFGFEVRAASGPGEGLKAAEELGARIDLVVADLVMPLMGGDELAVRLRKLAPESAALIISGRDEPVAPLGGRFALLRKPFDEKALRSALERILPQARPEKASE
ncbi:MAG TPA: response regulator [Spirochaetales bacterium]|nr:response regulator [Spirochaetales bacterium]